MTIVIMLPWPAVALSPNSRERWHKIAALKQARADARYLALEQAPRARLPKDAPLSVTWLFCRPTAARRDLDNLISACKGYQDGIADALNFNDAQIQSVTGAWGEPVKGGRVELRIDALVRP